MWEDYALFSRPEAKVERCSYDVTTPSAIRDTSKATYRYLRVRWVIDKMYARKPIQFTSIRGNEIKNRVLVGNALSAINGGGKPLYISNREETVQKTAILPRNVEYVVRIHLEVTLKAVPGDSEDKFKDITMRRFREGECYHRPYSECWEFPTQFIFYEEDKIDTAYAGTERDLRYTLFDFGYSDTEDVKPAFFRVIMKDGTLDVRNYGAV